MKLSRSLSSLLLLAFVSTGALAADDASSQAAGVPAAVAKPPVKHKVKKLDRAEVDALLAAPESVVIIDVRRPDELTKIGGFPVYLSIQSKELEKSLAYIPKDRTIVTVSNHAARGLVAGDLLFDKGYHVAGAVGVEDYEKEGGTLVKIAPPPPKSETAAK